jgi:hypothetical protein
MMSEPMSNDHRRYQRYAVEGDVLIRSRRLFPTVGKLKDISSGGVGFEYVADLENALSETVEVDILFRKQIRLSRVPCRVAYDIRVNQPAFGSNGTRRCGLEFGRLSDQQVTLLILIMTGEHKSSSR